MSALFTTKISKRIGLVVILLVFLGLFQDLFASNTGNWLTVQLFVDQTNYQSKEIKLTLQLADQIKTKSFYMSEAGSQTIYETEFDLGNFDSIDFLKVVWPTSEEQILMKVAANQIISIEKPNFPEPPSHVFARVIHTHQIDLVWKDNSNNELGFSVERSLFADRDFVSIAEVGPNVNFYSDKTVEKSTTYYYRVRAISQDGRSYFDGAYQKTEENTGIVLEDVNQPLRMYPNPSVDYLDVRVNNEKMGDVIVRFIDKQGKELKSLKFNKKIKDLKTKVDISSLPFGVYFVEISLITYKTLFKST